MVVHMTPLSDATYTSGQETCAAFRCDHCGSLSIGTVEKTIPLAYSMAAREYMRSETTPEMNWYPKRLAGKEFPDVPPHIASAADEAHRCSSIGAYRAAILLGRSVVEATAKDKGVDRGTLAAKIDELEAAGHVRPLIAATAHEIRYLGNDMAHGDFVEPATNDQAEDVLAFMDEVLNEVYQTPARVNARKAARTAAKASN